MILWINWLQYLYMITEFRLIYPIFSPIIHSLLNSLPKLLQNFNKFQMLMNVRRTTMAAAHWPLVTTYLTVTIAPACQVTPVMDSTVQVSLVTAMNLVHSCYRILVQWCYRYTLRPFQHISEAFTTISSRMPVFSFVVCCRSRMSSAITVHVMLRRLQNVSWDR